MFEKPPDEKSTPLSGLIPVVAPTEVTLRCGAKSDTMQEVGAATKILTTGSHWGMSRRTSCPGSLHSARQKRLHPQMSTGPTSHEH